jgi:cytochrome c-type biogenesis protein CcmH/NrfG
LGVGPLVPIISSDTLLFRQWYWGAAIGMILARPFLGVGPDGYGRFYGEFRSMESAEMFTLGASAAHNVPLQWAATLGAPAALAYVGLMLIVGVAVVRRLWKQSQQSSALLIPVAAVWVAYQVQSQVSIDATGVAIFGWLSTGLLLALSRPQQPELTQLSGSGTGVVGWVSAGVLAVLAIALWWPALNASNASRTVVQGTSEQDVLQAISLVQSNVLPCEPSVSVGRWMIQVAPAEQTVNGVFAGAEANERCYGLINAAADFSIQLEQPEQALKFAQQGVVIDPLNYQQWLILARAQHANGDDGAAVAALDTALELAPQAEAAIQEFAQDLGLVVANTR